MTVLPAQSQWTVLDKSLDLIEKEIELCEESKKEAPTVGLEPTTTRLKV